MNVRVALRSRAAGVAALVLWLLPACVTRTLSPSFPEPKAPTAEEVLAALLASERPGEASVAVGVGADGGELLCWDLTSGQLRWRLAAAPTTAPILAGEQVVTQEGDRIVLRSVSNGRTQLVLDADGVLVGADGAGPRSVISILHDEDGPRASVVMVEAGRVRWRVALNLPAGRPALIGSYVVTPWATHRISILDAADGAERVRWFFTGTVLGHAQVQDGQVYVGQHGWIPVTRDLLALQAGDIRPLAPAPRQLPGHPSLLRDGYSPLPAPDSAEHRLRLHWQVGPSAEEPVLGDRAYLRFYRMVFGLRASADELVWVRHFDRDLVGASQTAHGLWIADTEGVLQFVAHDGSLGKQQLPLGAQLSTLTMRGAPAPEALTPQGDESVPAGDLTAQLTAAATLDDTRLGAARAYAVAWLSRQSGLEITRILVELCVQGNAPEPVHRSACQALEERPSGHHLVVAALKAQARETASRGHVGALALVASKLGLRGAVPAMLAHFDDLRTSTPDLVAIVEALDRLAAPQAAPTLERFVRMHHGEPDGSEVLPVVTRSIETLGGLRARRSKPLLTRLAEDGLSHESVREAASEALREISTPRPKKPAPTPAVAKAAPAPAAKPPADTRPERLSPGLVRAALKPASRSLRRCLNGEAAQARIAMVVDGAGEVEGVFVTPSELQSCIEPLVRAQTFPATKLGRQRVTHVVQRLRARGSKR